LTFAFLHLEKVEISFRETVYNIEMRFDAVNIGVSVAFNNTAMDLGETGPISTPSFDGLHRLVPS
jgi:hypothetical protein